MKNLFIILDGLGHDQIMKFQPPGLIERGKQSGMIALDTLLAYSSGIYPAIWTGLYPDQTNFWTEFLYQDKPQLSIFNPLILLKGKYFPRKVAFALSAVCQKMGIHLQGYFGIPPIVQDYFTRLNVNYKNLPPIDLPYSELISTVFSQNKQNLKFLHCEVLDTKSRIDILQYTETADTLIVCIAETDHYGHLLGPLNESYQPFLFDLDERLSQLLEQIETSWPKVNIYFFSDHGMTAVQQAFDLWTYLEKYGFYLGKEYIAFINSTVVSLWFDRDKQNEIVTLLNVSGVGRVLTHEERVGYHLDFCDRRYGDEIFIMNEGIELIPNFISAAWKPNLGMHGYDPACSSTQAFFIGSKNHSPQPTNVVDIYNILKSCVE